MAIHQYIGARYVPKFFENPDGTNTWIESVPYEPLTIVTYLGNSYTSKKAVPPHIDIDNHEYWVLTGAYNAQVEEAVEKVNSFEDVINEIKGIYINVKDYGAIGDGVADDTQAILSAIDNANDNDAILFPNGVYKVSSNILIKDKFITVLGFGATLLCDFTGDYVLSLDVSPTYDGQGTSLQNRTDLWQLYGVYGLTIDCNNKTTSGLLLSNYRGNAFYVSVHNCRNIGIRSRGISWIENCKITGVKTGASVGIVLDRADNYISNIEVIDCKTAYRFGGFTRAHAINAWIRFPEIFDGSIYIDIPNNYQGNDSQISNSVIDTYQKCFNIAKTNVAFSLNELHLVFNATEVVPDNPDSYIFYIPSGATNSFIGFTMNDCGFVGMNRANETKISNVDIGRLNLTLNNFFVNIQGVRNYILPTYLDVTGLNYTVNRGTFDGSVLNMTAIGTGTYGSGTIKIATLPVDYSIMVNDFAGDVIGEAYWFDTSQPNWQYNPKYKTLIRLAQGNAKDIYTSYPTGASGSMAFVFKITTGNATQRYRMNNLFN